VRWTWPVHLFAFNGRDLRLQPLVKRQACLQALLELIGCPTVSLSEPFKDGVALLRAAEVSRVSSASVETHLTGR
jgi:hypothetical protein